jgi:hypothetical protein
MYRILQRCKVSLLLCSKVKELRKTEKIEQIKTFNVHVEKDVKYYNLKCKRYKNNLYYKLVAVRGEALCPGR